MDHVELMLVWKKGQNVKLLTQKIAYLLWFFKWLCPPFIGMDHKYKQNREHRMRHWNVRKKFTPDNHKQKEKYQNTFNKVCFVWVSILIAKYTMYNFTRELRESPNLSCLTSSAEPQCIRSALYSWRLSWHNNYYKTSKKVGLWAPNGKSGGSVGWLWFSTVKLFSWISDDVHDVWDCFCAPATTAFWNKLSLQQTEKRQAVPKMASINKFSWDSSSSCSVGTRIKKKKRERKKKEH